MMRNTLLTYTLLAAATLAGCNKSAPETGAAPADSAGAVTSEAPAAASADSAAKAAVPSADSAAAATAPAMPAGELPASLTSDIGVTPAQATAGTGAVLAYAQNKLPASDFQKVAGSLPGGGTASLDAAKAAGIDAASITDVTGLNAALGKLGIPPETASKFVPEVTKYLGQVGGPEVSSLVSGLF